MDARSLKLWFTLACLVIIAVFGVWAIAASGSADEGWRWGFGAGLAAVVLVAIAFAATPNLGLKNDYTDSDVTTRSTFNTPVDYLDRMAEWFERFAGHGVETGWELQSEKTVSAGSGVVNHFWLQTTSAVAVTGWTAGVVNYVNAHPNISVDGSSGQVTFGVSFIATTSSVVPTGAIPIASCTLDSSSDIVADTISHSRALYAYHYQWVVRSLNISRNAIAAGATVTATVPYGDTYYGAPTIDVAAQAGFTVSWHSLGTTQFGLDITNDTAYQADYATTATVRGIAGV